MDWEDVRTFLALARTGTVTAAAGDLDCNPSTVTRRLAHLERSLQAKLFERRRTGYAPTAIGESLIEEASAIEHRMVALRHRLSAAEQRPAGRVIFSAPAGIAGRVLAPYLPEFHARYPDIELEIVDDDVPLNVQRHEADVVLRATNQPPEQLIGRRLGRSRALAYASPAYLERADPERPELILSPGLEDQPLRAWATSVPGARTVLSTRSRELRIRAACAGLGICFLPEVLGAEEPQLQPLSWELPEHPTDIWLLTHPDLRMAERVRAFQAFLMETLDRRDHKYLY